MISSKINLKYLFYYKKKIVLPAPSRPAELNLGFAHQDCGTRSLVIKITRTAVQYHAWTAVQCARWIASPPALMDSLNGLSRLRLRWPSSAARADCLLSPSTHADCAGPVQLRARTACCPRALMACAVIARLACRGWPAPLTNSGTAVYPRTTRRPQSTRPHSLR